MDVKNFFPQVVLILIVPAVFVNDLFAGAALAAQKKARQKAYIESGQYQRDMMHRRMQQEVNRQVMERYKKEVVPQLVAQKMALNQLAAQKQKALQPQVKMFEDVPDSEVKDVADITEIVNAFEVNSEVWSLIIDLKPKLVLVDRFIKEYAAGGVKLSKNPLEYTELIDSITRQSPSLFQKPFKELLQYVAIIEYDFENGKNKDMMALQLLGDAGFWENKRRLEKTGKLKKEEKPSSILVK